MEENMDDDFNVSMGDDEFGINNSSFLSITSMESQNSFDIDEGELGQLGEVEFSSTPKKVSAFKKPAAPSRSSKKAPVCPKNFFGRCTVCGQYLKTARGFNQHIKNHRWKDAAALIPPVDEIIKLCETKLPEVLDSLIVEFNMPTEGHFQAQKFICALKDMKLQFGSSEWNSFVEILMAIVKNPLTSPDGKKALPSALRPILQISVVKMFSEDNFRKKLWDAFCKLTSCDVQIGWNILFPIAKKVSELAFTLICKVMRGDKTNANSVRSKDDFDHILSQQTIHHVAGSALRSHFRAAFSHPKNAQIQNIKKCIMEKFARIGPATVATEKDPQYWTSLINRKSLLFLHDSAMPFFIGLAKLLQRLENADGLSHEKVMEAVTGSPNLLLMWDSIVEDYLSEDESFRFMAKIVKSITNTFGKGMLNRRMNGRVKSGQGNKTQLAIGHRARLVGKVTQCPTTSDK